MGQMAFGKDFGMVKSGRDELHVWHLIEKSTLYVVPLFDCGSHFRTDRASTLHSAFQLISHLPWLAKLLALLPQKANPIALIRRIANENVMQRMREGSHRRDLFHYLVRNTSLVRSSCKLLMTI